MNGKNKIISNDLSTNVSAASVLRMTAIGAGLAIAGLSMQANAACTTGSSVVCGIDASTSSIHGIAIGQNSTAAGSQSIAIGGGGPNGDNNTKAIGEQSIAIGANVEAKGHSSIAIGGDDLNAASTANIDGTSSNSFLNTGTVNTAFKSYANRDLVDTTTNQSVYDGTTKTEGAASVAIGVKANSEGALSTAMGTHASSSGTASTALGVASSATKDGSVALGAGSTTDTNATSVKTMTVGGVQYNVAGNVLDSNGDVKTGAQVSVGTVGSERQIKNVAAGQVSATSTDAINGSQLFATNSAVNANTSNINSLNTSVTNNTNRINSLGYRLDDVEDDSNAGISAAMAMSSLPQSYIPGKSMLSGGIATYNGESAMAIGVSKVTDNGRWVIKGNASADTQGNFGGAVGGGYHF